MDNNNHWPLLTIINHHITIILPDGNNGHMLVNIMVYDGYYHIILPLYIWVLPIVIPRWFMVHGVITRRRFFFCVRRGHGLDGAGLLVSCGDVEHDLRQPLGVEPESGQTGPDLDLLKKYPERVIRPSFTIHFNPSHLWGVHGVHKLQLSWVMINKMGFGATFVLGNEHYFPRYTYGGFLKWWYP